MNEDFVRNRITELRLNKKVSEYQMSYDLGHSRGYINNISSGKSLPSMSEFLYICEYFEITPAQFFDGDEKSPSLFAQVEKDFKELKSEDKQLIAYLCNQLKQK